jgi:hypothetical protein
MKYTIAAIVLIAIGLVIAVAFSGHSRAGDMGVLFVAMASVCVFGSIPVLLGVRSKKNQPPRRTVVTRPLDQRPPDQQNGQEAKRSS